MSHLARTKFKDRSQKEVRRSSQAGIRELSDRQDQKVSHGGNAIQAGGNVTIGLSASEVAKIIRELADTADKYTQVAREVVDQRFDELSRGLLARFGEPGANAEAFKDPDFQYTVREGHHAYARSGDPAVRETLIDIIARRSTAKTQSREALTLNDAAARAPKLSHDEFSVLSLCYMLKYVIRYGVDTPEKLAKFLRDQIIPHTEGLELRRSTLWHIESQSLGSISIMHNDLRDVLTSSYASVLGMGMTKEDVLKRLGAAYQDKLAAIMRPCVRESSKWQPDAETRKDFVVMSDARGVPKPVAENIWKGYLATVPREQDFIALLDNEAPGFAKLDQVWAAGIDLLSLNSVGIAIAHANAKRVTNLDAPLSTWIN